MPAWCVFENVRGILSLESGVVFDSLLSELEAIGYETQTFIIPACAVDAPHRRDRVWIIGYNTNAISNTKRTTYGKKDNARRPDNKPQHGNGVGDDAGNLCKTMADPTSRGQQGSKPSNIKIDKKAQKKRCEQTDRAEGRSKTMANPNGAWELQPQGCQQNERGWSGDGGKQNVTNTVSQHDDNGRHGTGKDGREQQEKAELPGSKNVPNATSGARCAKYEIKQPELSKQCAEFARWPTEPDVGRVAHGVPNRVDRLKCLGNAVVPQIVEIIGRAIMKIEYGINSIERSP